MKKFYLVWSLLITFFGTKDDVTLASFILPAITKLSGPSKAKMKARDISLRGVLEGYPKP